MTLFYSILCATFLITHLWAATAGDEGAESDDCLTKMCAVYDERLRPFLKKEGLVVEYEQAFEKWEEVKADIRAQFYREYPQGSHLDSPEAFWVLNCKSDRRSKQRTEDLAKDVGGSLLCDIYDAYYKSEIERIEPKYLAFVKSRESLPSCQPFWQEMLRQAREAKASTKPEEALIALLPEGVRHLGLDLAKLEKERFMLFSAPIVPSPAWDALTEVEKIKHFDEDLIISAVTFDLRNEAWRKAMGINVTH